MTSKVKNNPIIIPLTRKNPKTPLTLSSQNKLKQYITNYITQQLSSDTPEPSKEV